ncbi:MAG TPA: hypothetical protein VF997_19275, partial [Polyangia bacterium]
SNAQQSRQTLQGGGTDPSLQGQAGLNTPGGSSSSSNPLTAGASAISSQFGVIKDVLEQAIRRVTIKIGWTEGRAPMEVELVAYYVDVRRVDQAIQIGNAAAAGQQGGGGAGGSGGGSTGGGSTGGGSTGGGSAGHP